MDENLLFELKQNIFYRAKYFLDIIGDSIALFVATHDGETIKDIMAYEDFEESIDSIILINMLRGSISKELKSGLVKAGAIAYDVRIGVNDAEGVEEKRDAICLIISVDGENWEDSYYPYRIINNECVWG